jgi:hypothetical protein
MITSGLWIREHAGVAWGWSGWRPTRTTYRRWLLPMTHLTAYLSPDDRTEAEAVRRHLCQLLFDLYPSHDRDNEVCNHFDFTHPYSDDESQYEAWARELVVGVFGPDIPLDYAESHVTDNC